MSYEEKYIEKWFLNKPQYSAYAEYIGPNKPVPPASLIHILNLDVVSFKEFSKETLELFEDSETYKEFSSAVRAFTQFQDIFNFSLNGNDNPSERFMFNRHYCYFESLIYLREGVRSWLDGNILASLALLRPFFELSLLHIYWYLRCEEDGYKAYYEWLDGKKGKPPFKNQLDFVFSNLPSNGFANKRRVDKVKEFLLHAWGEMSTYNHTPRIDESIVSISNSSQALSVDGMYLYLAKASMLLRHIIFVYVLCFPMSLYPIDRVRKWGFGGPAGLFFDHQNFRLLCEYLEKNSVDKLTVELKEIDQVKTLLSWYESFPILLKSRSKRVGWILLKVTAQEDNHHLKQLKDVANRSSSHKAHFRTLSWFMNYHHEEKPLPDISDEKLMQIYKAMNSW